MHGPRSSRAVPNPHTGAFRVFVRSAALLQARRPSGPQAAGGGRTL